MPVRKPAAGPASENDGEDGAPAWRARPRRPFPDEAGVVGVLVLLVFGVGLLKPDFLQTGNLLTTAHNSVSVGLMACGTVFALAMREVDLSVGDMYAMGIVVGALLIRDGWNPWLAALAVLALSALLGTVNGAVTTHLRLPSFIVARHTDAAARHRAGTGRGQAGHRPAAGPRVLPHARRRGVARRPERGVGVRRRRGRADRRVHPDEVRRAGASHRL